MGDGWPLPKMEGKILMSRESENIVKQWEEQKAMQQQGNQLEKLIIQMVKPTKPKPKPKSPKKKK